MITCKLSTILGSKRMTRGKLHRKSGVSMPALKALYDDTWKGINRNTVNSLCKALEITPAELFEFVPDENEEA